MSTKRPLLDTGADQLLYVADESRRAAVAASLRPRNVLAVGDAGAGKTSLLFRIRAEAANTSPPRSVLYVDARLAADPRELIALIARRAEDEEWIKRQKEPSPDDPFGPVALIERLRRAPKDALVLLDDPTPAQAIVLFGRYRDELWQTPVFFATVAAPPTSLVLRQPPADVFFDSIIELKPFEPDTAFELLRRRKEKGHIPDQVLWPTHPQHPRALLLDAETGGSPGRHNDALRHSLNAAAQATMGRQGAVLLQEIWGRGALSASDPDFQRRLGVSRARLTQVLRELERAEILISFPDLRQSGIGRPKTLYDVNDQYPT